MSRFFSKPIVWWITAGIGFNLLAECYILAWQGTNSYWLFWLGLGISCFSLLLVMLTAKNKMHILLACFMLGLVIYSLQIFRSPEYFIDRDEMMHYQGYVYMIENGAILQHHTTFPIVANYPGLEITITGLADETGMSPATIGRIFVGIIHSLLLLIIWLFLINLDLDFNMASIGTFIYAINPRYVLFDSMVSYESLGIFFMFILVYLIQKMMKKKDVFLSLISILVLLSLVITHHLSSYMLLLYGLVLIAVQYIISMFDWNKDKANIFSFIGLAIAITFGWLIYVAVNSVNYLAMNLKVRILAILNFSFFGGPGARILMQGAQVPAWEHMVAQYLYPLVLFLLSIAGALIIYKNNKRDAAKMALIIYGPVLFLCTWPLVPASDLGAELAYRTWSFFFIGVAFAFAYAFRYLFSHREKWVQLLAIPVLIVVFIGGVSISRNAVLRFPTNRTTVDDTSFYTLDLYRAAEWLDGKAGTNWPVMGTVPELDVLGSYGAQFVNPAETGSFMIKDPIDPEIWGKYLYLAIDRRITSVTYFLKTSFENGYFGVPLAPPYEDVGNKTPFPENLISRYDDYPSMTEVYDNGDISLYRNIEGT